MQDDARYTIDVRAFNELVVARLEAIPSQPEPWEPRIFADRISASLSPTRKEVVTFDGAEIRRRFGLVLDQIGDPNLRELVEREVFALATP